MELGLKKCSVLVMKKEIRVSLGYNSFGWADYVRNW